MTKRPYKLVIDTGRPFGGPRTSSFATREAAEKALAKLPDAVRVYADVRGPRT